MTFNDAMERIFKPNAATCSMSLSFDINAHSERAVGIKNRFIYSFIMPKLHKSYHIQALLIPFVYPVAPRDRLPDRISHTGPPSALLAPSTADVTIARSWVYVSCI